MNKISNWLFGSFFRTIGRVIAFSLIGYLIAYFVQSNGLLDDFSIVDLFSIQKVNASSTDISFIENLQLYTDAQVYASVAGNPVCTNSSGASVQNCNFDFAYPFDYNYTFNKGEGYYLLVPFQYMITNDNDTTSIVSQFEVSAQLFDSTGTSYICQIENGLIICPLANNKTYIRINIRGTAYYNILTTNIRWKIHSWANVDKNVLIEGNQEIQSAIENQTQQQQQQHNETQSYLEDSNTTQAENEATDFFQGFSSTDHGGLSSIITAPLNTIQSLLNSTCTNLVLPLPFVNENLTLPCLNSIYTEFFGAFFTIYQTIILGIIAYKCIRSIYYDIHGFMDPNDDRIEVMDL